VIVDGAPAPRQVREPTGDRSPSSGILQMMRNLLFVALVAGGLPPALPMLHAQTVPFPMDTVDARRFFLEVSELITRDAGALWGRTLEGPMLFVHAPSRTVLTLVPGSGDTLRPMGGFFTGTLPDAEPVANSSLDWNGRRWAMVVWPPRADSLERRVLFAHELWHRVQDSLGFSSGIPSNAHLGSRNGRLWLRLEGRALRKALVTSGPARARALQDAIAFRRERRRLFPGSDSDERTLELNEGLAEYSGIMLATASQEARIALTDRRLALLDSATSFERDFAYRTGPAWGLLLDELKPGWRTGLVPTADLAMIAAQSLGTPRGPARSASARGAAYGLAAVRKHEDARAEARKKHIAFLQTRFVDGPVLELPLADMKMSFDPGKVEAMSSLGSVYGMLRLTDRWGVLQCDLSGGLIATDFRRALVPAPSDTGGRRLTGPGWVLELLPGWRLVPGPRPGDWAVQQSP